MIPVKLHVEAFQEPGETHDEEEFREEEQLLPRVRRDPVICHPCRVACRHRCRRCRCYRRLFWARRHPTGGRLRAGVGHGSLEDEERIDFIR